MKLTAAFVTALAAAVLAAGTPSLAGNGARTSRFLIETRHTPEQCLKDLDMFAVQAPGMLRKLEWGCKSGDHSGYAIVEATDEAAARAMLPEPVRKEAKVVKLNRFTVKEIHDLHEMQK